ncbi:PLC-like phosphodiesterase [Aspergillus heteromorphus CBS 117.55]|uniref:PLC-like phosphodiesterase n=1 Tax=Aspergillus heteromorphus CBS 117.55 TaxID=1448321 RepID=A0A317W5U4_9EURO|nr:PLC-like phosphodiesterase [Aspergillus heteromorphus CBS 117.55]PWY80607.1 PLC-like phosphodiesterase [Aspergillus heteromorphus CBS 117.55]
MTTGHLTIRNLTSTPITLKRIERFHAPGRSFDCVYTFVKNFGRVFTNVTRATTPVAAIDEDTQPFAEQDVDIGVTSFETIETELRPFIDSEKERIRWTFEVEGEEHQIQTPVPTTESATMKALCNNPKFNLTGIYVTAACHLTIYSSANLNAWMRELNDDTVLSSISIPGTHNSPTYHTAAPSVRCQAVSPREQLRNGVRFFDIRVQPQHPTEPSKDGLILVHGVFPVSLTGNKYLRDLMSEVNEFLEHNPSETLIMSLKREGPGNHTDEQLSRIINDHYACPGSRWYTKPEIPTLGEVRGKVVLVRRFNILENLKEMHEGKGWGIDASGWADNCSNATCPSGLLCIQDFYEILKTQIIDQKLEYVREHCERAGNTQYPFGVPSGLPAMQVYPLYINFLSGSNFWKTGTWPEKIASRLNPAIVEYLCRKHADGDGDWSTGILVTDWVGLDGDWDLVRCIVGMNARLSQRQLQYKLHEGSN